MTFEEGLDRIPVRHPSVAQSAEMLVIENRSLAEQGKPVGRQLSELRKSTDKIALGTAGPLTIVAAHEYRIDRWEDQL